MNVCVCAYICMADRVLFYRNKILLEVLTRTTGGGRSDNKLNDDKLYRGINIIFLVVPTCISYKRISVGT